MGSEDLVSGSSDADQERVTKLEQALAYVELKVTQFVRWKDRCFYAMTLLIHLIDADHERTQDP